MKKPQWFSYEKITPHHQAINKSLKVADMDPTSDCFKLSMANTYY